MDDKLKFIVNSIYKGVPADDPQPRTEDGRQQGEPQGEGKGLLVWADKLTALVEALTGFVNTPAAQSLFGRFMLRSPGEGSPKLGRPLTSREWLAWARWAAQSFKGVEVDQAQIDAIIAKSPEEALSAIHLGIEFARKGGASSIFIPPTVSGSEPPAPTMGAKVSRSSPSAMPPGMEPQ